MSTPATPSPASSSKTPFWQRGQVWLGGMISSFVVGPLLFVLAEQAPGIFIFAVGCVFLALKCASVAFVKQPDSSGPASGDRYPSWQRYTAMVVGALAVVVGIIGSAAQAGEAKLWVRDFVRSGMTFDPPDVEIRLLEGTDVAARDSDLWVEVDGYPAAEDFSCEWQGAYIQKLNVCETKLEIPLDKGQVKQQVSVVVRKDGQWIGTDTREFVSTARLRIEVQGPRELSPTDIFSGEPIMLKASVNDQPVQPIYRCDWRIDERTVASGPCQKTEVVAPDVPPGKPSKEVVLHLDVLDSGRQQVGVAQETLTISRPQSNYAVFVLEASRRMVRVQFDAARAALAREVAKVALTTGYLGIEIFGAAGPHSTRLGCTNIYPLVRLAPVNAKRTQALLNDVRLGDTEAPLHAAMGAAIEALAAKLANDTNATTRLVALVAGPDTCQQETLSGFLRTWNQQIWRSGLARAWRDYEFLSLTVFADPEQRTFRAWMQDRRVQAEYSEGPFVVVFATNPAQLDAVVSAATALANSDRKVRERSCRELVDLVSAGPPKNKEITERYCDNLK